MAYVLKGKKEYIFKKGSPFSEATSGDHSEYDHAYALVSPCSMAPMALFLSEKKDD